MFVSLPRELMQQSVLDIAAAAPMTEEWDSPEPCTIPRYRLGLCRDTSSVSEHLVNERLFDLYNVLRAVTWAAVLTIFVLAVFVAVKRHFLWCPSPASEVAASPSEKTEENAKSELKSELAGDAALINALPGPLDGSVDHTPFWLSFEGIAIAVLLVLAGSCYVVQLLL